ncbi:MAG: metallophosphoesterase, partial [Saprospiraceae bacterium]
ILDVHNESFGGEVYLVEERPDDDWSIEPSFGNSKEIVSTSDAVEDLMKNHENRIDQPYALRARLLDLVIGDWDRHDDQWRFAKIEIDGIDYYRPIPRDRDQVFSKYDGTIAGVARWTMPFLRQLRPYSPEIKNMKWNSWSSRYFDHSFLNEMEWADWEREAKWMQAQLTDEVIDRAFATFPKLAYEITGEEIKTILKERRNNLVKFAKEFYGLLATHVDVVGTNDEDGFDVERLPDGKTRVSMYDLETDDGVRELVYERTFSPKETKEIVLYGSSEEDVFNITGEADHGILVRIVGGVDKDKVVDQSKVGGLGKKTLVYDAPDDVEIEGSTETKDKTTDRRNYNIYDRKAWHYEHNFLIPVPLIGFNPDNGFLLGANLLWTTYKFKKDPYHATHNVQGSYAFATQSPQITYTGDFLNTFGKWDLLVNAGLRGNQFTLNYYGTGNETLLTEQGEEDRDFNRVRQSGFELHPAIKRRFYADEASIYIGPLFEMTEIERTEGRFLTELAADDPDQFEQKFYVGGELGFQLNSVDHPTIVRRGVRLAGYLNYRNNLNDSELKQTTIGMEAAAYLPLVKSKKIVFASRIGVDHAFEESEFFYLPNIGGHNRSLRGFRFNRFYGTTAFFHNNDLRLELFKSVNHIMPFTFGLTAGYDYGRIWLDDVESDEWHDSYGGGIWIAPVDFIILSGEYFRSDEDARIMIQLGYAF